MARRLRAGSAGRIRAVGTLVHVSCTLCTLHSVRICQTEHNYTRMDTQSQQSPYRVSIPSFYRTIHTMYLENFHLTRVVWLEVLEEDQPERMSGMTRPVT